MFDVRKGLIQFLFIFVLLHGMTIQAAESSAFIQIKSQEGVSIFLDDHFKGLTKAEFGGLIIETIPGHHEIKIVKEGFLPQIQTIVLIENQVFEFSVSEFIPQVTINQEGQAGAANVKAQTGTIIIQTIPVECQILIPSLGVTEDKEKSHKIKDKWIADPVPPGIYSCELISMGKHIQLSIDVQPEKTAHLMINMLTGEIKDIAKTEEFRKIEQARQEEEVRIQREAAETAHRESERIRTQRESRKSEIQNAINEIKNNIKCYSVDVYGWGRKTFNIEFGYRDYSQHPSVEERRVSARVTLDMGNMLSIPVDPFISAECSDTRFSFSAKAVRTHMLDSNKAWINVFNHTGKSRISEYEKELAEIDKELE